MYTIEQRTDSGYFYCNLNHYHKVIKERAKRGLEDADNKLRNKEIKDHPYIGKRIFNKANGKWYLIEKVNKQWHGGFYLGMLIQCNGSHAFRWFENINSVDETICEACEKFVNEFDLENMQDA